MAKKTTPKKKAARATTAVKTPTKKVSPKGSAEPLRFAHPSFTKPTSGQQPHGLMGHIQGLLQAVPAPKRPPTMELADIIGTTGAQQIAGAPFIRFHAVGDTGHSADSPQGDVAHAMTADYDTAHPANSPAFFFHLGDVIYGTHKDQSYRREFYEPYVHYPGKIIAIPGNHDGETFPETDPRSLRAFLANFCAPSQTVPAIAGTIYRQTMNQPGVYWMLDAPFVQIVGLYSNAAENPGFISGAIPGSAQKTWLLQTLQAIRAQRNAGKRKALVLATHHPPFTAGGHSPSTDMLADIDGVCTQAQVMPDLFLSGHAHNYQRYTRNVTLAGKSMQIPFLVAGGGGVGEQPVPSASGQTTGDHTFVKSQKGYGYLLVEVRSTSLTVTSFAVNGETKTQFDQVTVDLTHNRVS